MNGLLTTILKYLTNFLAILLLLKSSSVKRADPVQSQGVGYTADAFFLWKKIKRVEGTDKLLKLEADLGKEKRQLVVDIAKFYQPEDLVGKEIVMAVNLEPRTFIRGVESERMLLAANVEGKPMVLEPDKEILLSTKIR